MKLGVIEEDPEEAELNKFAKVERERYTYEQFKIDQKIEEMMKPKLKEFFRHKKYAKSN